MQCAKEEFLEKGYEQANVRTIATKARATTGAVYNHFHSKSGLFDAIVSEFATKLLSLFTKAHYDSMEHYDFDDKNTEDCVGRGTNLVLDFVYSDFDLSKLLFCHSKGTKYEYLIDKMITIEEESSIQMLASKGFPLDKINRFFIHVIATSGMQNMIEAIRHDLTKEEAFLYMNKVQKFYYAGTKEVLEEEK